MTTPSCDSCLKSNATFSCGLCSNTLCKKCVQFVDPDHFAFSETVPVVASHNAYCESCYTTQVAPEVEKYEATLETARNMNVLYKGQGKEVRKLNISKQDAPLKIIGCDDYDELILRLAFRAAEKNYNVLVDVEADSKKIHNGGYVKLEWHGTAIPSHVDLAKINKVIDPRYLRYL